MHLQMRKKSWVEHQDHSGIPFGIYIIPVCRGTDQCTVCLYEPEWQNTELKIRKCPLIQQVRLYFLFFAFFFSGARSQLCSAVRF